MNLLQRAAIALVLWVGSDSDITPYTSAGHYIVGNDPCVVPYRGMLLTDLFPM